jgi:transposase
MYIRKTLKIDRKNGKTYSAFHLVESVRTDRGPRQRVLLYMGAEINAIPSEDGLTTIAIEWKVIKEKMQEKLTGSYFLRTNRTDLEAKELWQLYNVLRRVEDAFRFMKSSLGLRPVYHQKERRVDGHLWITIIAYHLIQHCRYQLAQKGINYLGASVLERRFFTVEFENISAKLQAPF